MTLVIGLTGGIASGKSTVSEMFKNLNMPVVDADKIAREVVMPGQEAYKQIVEKFGPEILREDQTLDRKKLGQIVFSDPKRREQLNKITHPAIRAHMLKERDQYVQAKEKCVVLDIPLLFESKLMHFVEKIIVVYVDEEVQIRRLMNRDQFSEREAKQRIQAQMPLKEKRKQADAVIDNNGTIAESFRQLKETLKAWSIIN